MILQRTAIVAHRLWGENSAVTGSVTDILNNVMAIGGPGRTLTEEVDWLAAFEKDPEAAFQLASQAQSALYEQIHVIRRETLKHLAGENWLNEISGRVSYKWFAGKEGGRIGEDTAARALAWLDYACTCRNKVVHHRVAGVRPRFVVFPDAICEVYWIKEPRLAEVVEQLRRARQTFGIPGDVPNSSESVAYLSAIAEKIYSVAPSASDVMNRAIRTSGVYVLVGSAPLVDNLDDAVATLLEERFPQRVN